MATIHDIARVLGVSSTTIANVLKGKSNVSELTRQRVMQYVEEIGYRPNILASGLAQRKTYTLGFILPTIANPFYPEIAEEIERIAGQHNYQVVLCNTHGDMVLGRQHLERLVSRWVDGIIVMGLSMDLSDLLAQFHAGLPIVLCNWQENESPQDIPHVSIDFYQAGALAARHLLEMGHHEMAIIADLPLQNHRVAGFRSVLQEAGIELDPAMIQQGNSELASGYTAARRLLAMEMRPTAIFAANDWMAIGAMEATRELGLRVPQDLSIIGLDDIVVSAHVYPALTTIAIPKQLVAQVATECLLQQVDGNGVVPTGSLVPPSFQLRQSTATPISADIYTIQISSSDD